MDSHEASWAQFGPTWGELGATYLQVGFQSPANKAQVGPTFGPKRRHVGPDTDQKTGLI